MIDQGLGDVHSFRVHVVFSQPFMDGAGNFSKFVAPLIVWGLDMEISDEEEEFEEEKNIRVELETL